MHCIHGDDGPTKRKVPGGAVKNLCGGCNAQKIEDAFPRAQLKLQDEKPLCLSCVQKHKVLRCAQCLESKPVEAFSTTMVTVPKKNVMCKDCQQKSKETPNRHGDKWFSCRTCGEIFSGAPEDDNKKRARRCFNCASRNTRQKDRHTCRNPDCGRTWHEQQLKGATRKRYCPQCRKKS